MTKIAQPKLEELMVKRRGSVDPSKFLAETFELFSIPAFDTGEAAVISGSEIGSSKQNVEPGDLLLSKIVPHIRRAWVVTPIKGYRQIASGEWMIFKHQDAFPDYLRHLLTSDWFHPKLMNTVAGVGGSLVRARPSEIARIEIPLPPLAEQKRIAATLDKADAIRRKLQQSLRLSDDFLRSVFLDMFGDPVTNPKGWPIVKIGDLLESTAYGTSTKASETTGAFPCLRMNNITYGGSWDFTSLKYVDLDAKEQKKNLVHSGQLLFNRTNSKELVGKTAVYRRKEPMAFAGYLVRGIANSEADTEYISAYLNLPHGKAVLQGMCKNIIGMANINAEEFKSIRIQKPPVTLQRRFAAIVHSTELKKETLKKLLAESEALFSSLQQRAFRGEL